MTSSNDKLRHREIVSQLVNFGRILQEKLEVMMYVKVLWDFNNTNISTHILY